MRKPSSATQKRGFARAVDYFKIIIFYFIITENKLQQFKINSA